MAKMPRQKPGRSKQDYQTPPELLTAVERRLHAPLIFDLACRSDNRICEYGYCHDWGMDALTMDWAGDIDSRAGWAWCNPPFADIEPWVKKAHEESLKGLCLAMLVPASVGSNWWRDWVERKAFALYLNPRVKFVGCADMYPKDCALLLYSPLKLAGSETWTWKEAV